MSEDCLTLNVWTPEHAKAAPVFVWIHGGSLVTGSGSEAMYDGAKLAKEGMIVVTINYRLGVLGYLAHPGLSAESPDHVSGNYGMLDQEGTSVVRGKSGSVRVEPGGRRLIKKKKRTQKNTES